MPKAVSGDRQQRQKDRPDAKQASQFEVAFEEKQAETPLEQREKKSRSKKQLELAYGEGLLEIFQTEAHLSKRRHFLEEYKEKWGLRQAAVELAFRGVVTLSFVVTIFFHGFEYNGFRLDQPMLMSITLGIGIGLGGGGIRQASRFIKELGKIYQKKL